MAKEDYDFYQVLLSSMATACQPSSVLTLFPDNEQCPSLRITPAIETVKSVFKHLEDSEGCREFFATTFETLQVECCAISCSSTNMSNSSINSMMIAMIVVVVVVVGTLTVVTVCMTVGQKRKKQSLCCCTQTQPKVLL